MTIAAYLSLSFSSSKKETFPCFRLHVNCKEREAFIEINYITSTQGEINGGDKSRPFRTFVAHFIHLSPRLRVTYKTQTKISFISEFYVKTRIIKALIRLTESKYIRISKKNHVNYIFYNLRRRKRGDKSTTQPLVAPVVFPLLPLIRNAN